MSSDQEEKNKEGIMSRKWSALERRSVSFAGAAGKVQWGKNRNVFDWATWSDWHFREDQFEQKGGSQYQTREPKKTLEGESVWG